ncbi:histidine utilization repressor [Pigmentiphaga sp.]|uniref:histidine utilization repressor n=1 Tax=Pigmentiphaga sp. TaxID=1977564 RepID=UPI00128D5BA1|nr:histidine utilization repressor [Pigmentiphaga sp.]MPS29728.1 histidine utilization repressor [Alcaligenaceae bacterium SAGV5]MPS54906.1 histidine utilization repressor [Alcaligenaceae bacterium SAGV3]MPT59191.1 histidine utilization repressor [Alcaligenaceae bacterium]
MKTNTPAYLQVKDFIKGRISSGQWRPGDPVPSEAELGAKFGLSRMTVNRALRELMGEGLVIRVQGSGSYVAELDKISSTISIRDIREEIIERGHEYSVRVVTVAAEKATAAVSRTLEVNVGSRVFHSILVHMEDSVPIQYEDRYVNPAVAPDYTAIDFTQVTPARHLLTAAPLSEASYSIEAHLPSPAEAGHLGIKPQDPCLVMVRRTVSGSNVGSIARLVYPGKLYRFQGSLQT